MGKKKKKMGIFRRNITFYLRKNSPNLEEKKIVSKNISPHVDSLLVVW
jgi:hypothetical protein